MRAKTNQIQKRWKLAKVDPSYTWEQIH